MTDTDWGQQISSVLGRGRVCRRPFGGGDLAPDTVVMEERITNYTFRRSPDGTWRLASLIVYGHGQLVTGRGCDAGGFVIRHPNHIVALNAILSAREEE